MTVEKKPKLSLWPKKDRDNLEHESKGEAEVPVNPDKCVGARQWEFLKL